MITIAQYFGDKPRTIAQEKTAAAMLEQVNLCLYKAKQDGCYDDWIDPDTNSQISGSKGGSGDGGFRTPDSLTGGPTSSHREAKGIDVYDPDRILALWCVKNKATLRKLGLYCEDFRWSPVWCHFQTRASKSGHVIYIPYSNWKKYPPLAPALEGQTPLPFKVKT